MRQLSKDLENIIEESKYQLRLEIAEKCLLQNASLKFIMEVCSLSKQEVTNIYNDLKKLNASSENLSSENFVAENTSEEKMEDFGVTKHQIFKETRTQKRELIRIEKLKTLRHREERERQAEIQRTIAIENTRLLMEKIKREQKNNRLLEIEYIDLKEKESKSKQQLKKPKAHHFKNSKKEVLQEDSNTLSEEQKTVASIGRCYLKGFTIEQAVLLSRASQEDVQRIYKSFENK